MQNTQAYFEHVYKKHFVAVANYAFRRVKSREIAEDITQETFIQAYKSIEKLKECDCEIAWLIKIASRVINRRCLREKRQVDKVPSLEVIEVPGDPDILREKEFEENLLDVLQEDEAKLIVLVYKYDYTISEAAKYFKISLSACKMRIFRAREKLRKSYAKDKAGSL